MTRRFSCGLSMRYCVLLILPLTFALSAGQPEGDGATSADDPDPDIALAFRLERGFQKLAKRIAPCVVSLQVSARPKTWTDEMRRISEHYSPDRKYEGSGVIVDPDGWII